MSIVKCCENCEYEYVSLYGLPCIKCIHNTGDVENFQPKQKFIERNKSVDEFAKRLTLGCERKSVQMEVGGEMVSVMTVDGIKELIVDVSELMKGGTT